MNVEDLLFFSAQSFSNGDKAAQSQNQGNNPLPSHINAEFTKYLPEWQKTLEKETKMQNPVKITNPGKSKLGA